MAVTRLLADKSAFEQQRHSDAANGLRVGLIPYCWTADGARPPLGDIEQPCSLDPLVGVRTLSHPLRSPDHITP